VITNLRASVIIQIFLDEFDIADDMRKPPKTPGEPRTVLVPVQPIDYASEKVEKYYRRGIGNYCI